MALEISPARMLHVENFRVTERDALRPHALEASSRTASTHAFHRPNCVHCSTWNVSSFSGVLRGLSAVHCRVGPKRTKAFFQSFKVDKFVALFALNVPRGTF